jgi:hypothetical protein
LLFSDKEKRQNEDRWKYVFESRCFIGRRGASERNAGLG